MEALRITETQQGVTLTVRVIPRASKNEIAGVAEGVLKVRLIAPPVEGAANAALLAFLAGQLGLRGGQVTLLAGWSARQKLVRIVGLSAQEVERRLLGPGT
ncbi:MAG: hypothetical protein C4309_07800 [Chloroflexota bacterium]